MTIKRHVDTILPNIATDFWHFFFCVMYLYSKNIKDKKEKLRTRNNEKTRLVYFRVALFRYFSMVRILTSLCGCIVSLVSTSSVGCIVRIYILPLVSTTVTVLLDASCLFFQQVVLTVVCGCIMCLVSTNNFDVFVWMYCVFGVKNSFDSFM